MQKRKKKKVLCLKIQLIDVHAKQIFATCREVYFKNLFRNRSFQYESIRQKIKSIRYFYKINLIESINNGNRSEWSPIWSVIIRGINKIGRPQRGSLICWRQTELDNTKSCYQLIITVTISEKKKKTETFSISISGTDNV